MSGMLRDRRIVAGVLVFLALTHSQFVGGAEDTYRKASEVDGVIVSVLNDVICSKTVVVLQDSKESSTLVSRQFLVSNDRDVLVNMKWQKIHLSEASKGSSCLRVFDGRDGLDAYLDEKRELRRGDDNVLYSELDEDIYVLVEFKKIELDENLARVEVEINLDAFVYSLKRVSEGEESWDVVKKILVSKFELPPHVNIPGRNK